MIRPTTIAQYLLGDREAILTIARARHAAWLALLLVFSAALARNYHKEPLLAEPWHLLGPFGASLVTGTVLFLLIRCWPHQKADSDDASPGHVGRQYLTFMTLYWMTAPLAWLYAIPWEHMLGRVDAVAANLWMLAIVSVWRVALIIRVISVIYDILAIHVTPVVVAYSSVVALISLIAFDLPMIQIMGGIAMGEAEAMIANAAAMVICMSVPAAIICAVWGFVVLARTRVRWAVDDAPIAFSREDVKTEVSTRVSGGAWVVAATACGIFLAIMPLTQSAQAKRHVVEWHLQMGRITTALDLLADRDEADFPPHWRPLPRGARPEDSRMLFEVLDEVLQRDDVPAWVRDHYANQFARQVGWRGRGYADIDRERLAEMILELEDRIDFDENSRQAVGMRSQFLSEYVNADETPAMHEVLRRIGALPSEPEAD